MAAKFVSLTAYDTRLPEFLLKGKTPWQSAAEADGITESERYLTKLARRTFLTLWSFVNPHTDECRPGGKGDGKELCDLLVVFGNNVLIFSDKDCEFPSHPNIEISWSRWYRRAIEKSAKQLAGAERFVKDFPRRVFLEKDCKSPLPIDLPDPQNAHYFLLAVTRGSYDAGKRHWGGGSSGSLMLNKSIVGDAHYKSPFQVGFPLQNRRFVHVLDEMTVDVLLEELDTVPDLVAYLECKERYFSDTRIIVIIAGEEQLLARYMCTMENGKHGLPAIPKGTDYLAIAEGDWEFYSVSPQRAAKKAADEISYLWDRLIEHQSSFIREGTAIALFDTKGDVSEHELIARVLAGESRLSRRNLAMHLHHALSQSTQEMTFARVLISGDRPTRAYVFLTAPKPVDVSYEEYREMRSNALFSYCHKAKLRFPNVIEAVGIASEPMTEAFSSQDFMYVELCDDMLDDDTGAKWREAMGELNVLQSPSLSLTEYNTAEFPIAFDFTTKPNFLRINDIVPMNRKMRRATAKTQRGRHKP